MQQVTTFGRGSTLLGLSSKSGPLIEQSVQNSNDRGQVMNSLNPSSSARFLQHQETFGSSSLISQKPESIMMHQDYSNIDDGAPSFFGSGLDKLNRNANRSMMQLR